MRDQEGKFLHSTLLYLCILTILKKVSKLFERPILTKRALRELKLLEHFNGHKNVCMGGSESEYTRTHTLYADYWLVGYGYCGLLEFQRNVRIGRRIVIC